MPSNALHQQSDLEQRPFPVRTLTVKGMRDELAAWAEMLDDLGDITGAGLQSQLHHLSACLGAGCLLEAGNNSPPNSSATKQIISNHVQSLVSDLP